MYHYVRPYNNEYPYFKHLEYNLFIEQLDFLEKKYGFLDPTIPLIDNHNKQGVILTFDDGLKDHFDYVLPELEKRNIKGVFYIPTGHYNTKKMIDVHRIHLLLGKYGGKVIYSSLKQYVNREMLTHIDYDDFRSKTYISQGNDNYTAEVKKTLNYYIDYKYRENVLDMMMAEYLPNENKIYEDFYLSSAEILGLARSGMLIGSHSVNHLVMSKISRENQYQEIAKSFKFIENLIGKQDIKTFCFPYGGDYSFTGETEDILNEVGCSYSFNVEPRDVLIEDYENRPQALPRYDCNMVFDVL